MCIRFGRRYAHCAELTTVSGGVIKWVDCCRYLGFFFSLAIVPSSALLIIKSCFFRAFNALYNKVDRPASEEVVLSLIRAKFLPVLF